MIRRSSFSEGRGPILYNMHGVQDDKAQHAIPFILSLLSQHHNMHSKSANPPPFFVGLSGIEGVGKSVLVDILKRKLTASPHKLATVAFSLDDLYLTHADQLALAQTYPDNPLLQHRGQPSTHDIPLALSVFAALKQNLPTRIPQFDKAAFSGQGDRVSESEWEEVNTDPSSPVRVVLFEGWCLGFRALDAKTLVYRHSAAVEAAKGSSHTSPYQGRLGKNTLENVAAINAALERYDELIGQLDALIHIDTLDPHYVFHWRLEQERDLRASRGSGLTDQQVKDFTDGFYPAYELYVDRLREGVFQGLKKGDWKGRQLRLVVGEDRRVKDVVVI